MSDPVGTAVAIASAVRDRQRSAVEVVEAALAQLALVDPILNAFCETRPEVARAMAREVDGKVARSIDPGPLAGVPVAIKDSIWEAGIPATAGSRALVDFRPAESAAVVERLVRAGAVIIGRTNVPEFCYRGNCANELYGATSNPWDTDRTPGGSSGGSAAAVAAGVVPLALGSDGGGSIRIPASFCGVAGLKPTYGLVPREPQWPGWWTLTHLGPLGFTVEDCALLLGVVAGHDDRDPASLPSLHRDYLAAARSSAPLAGMRIAYSANLGYIERIDTGVHAAFETAVHRFGDLGAVLEEAHPAVANPIDDWNTLATADNYASEGALLATGRVGQDARNLIEAGLEVSGPAYAGARNNQMKFAAEWAHFMRRYDLVLTPTTECVAFPLGRLTPAEIGGEQLGDFFDDWAFFCVASNMTGQPAMSVPMGTAEHGMPIGLQIIGRRFGDETVLRAAAAWERIAPWPRPPIVAL